MPFANEDMPTEAALKKWKYLEEASKLIPGYDEKIPFGLMIGNTCTKALEPLQCIPSIGNGPFAYRTRLGWCVVGPSGKSPVSEESQKCFYTQVRVHAQDAVSGKQTSHYFLPPARVQETTISDRLKAMYSTEFSERFTEGKALSVEDRKFLEIMRLGVKKVDGHYEAPVPFRNADVALPNNKDMAVRRLLAHKSKMQRDAAYRDEYSRSMGKLISERSQKCEPLSSPSQDCWYIPHHAVHQKGKDLRVVFDSSAKYRERSLNDELLQGPDLVNLLVGVLVRFRKESVAYSAYLEACFHQIGIPPSQRRRYTERFFRFL